MITYSPRDNIYVKFTLAHQNDRNGEDPIPIIQRLHVLRAYRTVQMQADQEQVQLNQFLLVKSETILIYKYAADNIHKK